MSNNSSSQRETNLMLVSVWALTTAIMLFFRGIISGISGISEKEVAYMILISHTLMAGFLSFIAFLWRRWCRRDENRKR
ncbi:MAG: hypothetical protein WA947_08505 [Phormidesmis sp.]